MYKVATITNTIIIENLPVDPSYIIIVVIIYIIIIILA